MKIDNEMGFKKWVPVDLIRTTHINHLSIKKRKNKCAGVSLQS